MRVPDHIVQQRRERLAGLLQEQQYLPISEICSRLGISEATARRDLAVLSSNENIRRTFGGAISFYNARFPSFHQRLRSNQNSKRLLACHALQFLHPHDTCFLDAGTTVYLLADELRQHPVTPLTIVTGNLPAAELLAEIPGLSVHLLGGQLVIRQSVLLGPACIQACQQWKFQIALLSAEGMNQSGLWNSQAEVIAIQKAVISRSQRNLVLLDQSKLGHHTDYLLANWNAPLQILTDAPPTALSLHHIPPEKNIYISR